MSIPLYQVDAFADAPFTGNPAGVCVLPATRDETWMQHVAAEMNLSETAFLVARDGGYDLRWFTPTVEVELCGHATLASAHILATEDFANPDEPLRFHTKSGVLEARAGDGEIVLDLPADPATEQPAPAGLAEALGAPAVWYGRSSDDHLVELGSERVLRALRPDIKKVAALGDQGVIVTARGGETDFVSRYFAPNVGIPEDPATGAAHCTLTPYWAAKLGRDEMTAFQASARGARIGVRLRGDRVALTGRAVTIFRATLA